MPMNDMQFLAAYGEFDKDVLVSAGAGSGKTQVLTSRVTNLIEKGVKPTELLVLTFTNAAAAEMKARVRAMLNDKPKLRDSVALLEQAYITTFDSFNLSMCKKYFYALNISPNLGICDSSSMKIKKQEIIDDILNELYESHDPALEEYLNKFTDKRDDKLKDNLFSLINSIDKLDDSLEYLRHYDEKFFSDDFKAKIKHDYLNLCLNYKEKAVKILDSLMASTNSLKSQNAIQAIIDCFLQNSYEGIKEASSMDLPRKGKNDSDDFSSLKESLKKEALIPLFELTSYSSLDEAIEKYLSSKPSVDLFINILIKYYERIEAYCSKTGLYEFNDIQKLAIRLVKNNLDIRMEMQKQFKYILIDEYQDTSDLQEGFISYFKNNNRFMVGDIKQSIYRFRNANPNIFKQKYESYYSINKDNYPSKRDEYSNFPGYLIDMNQNFRSREEVLSDINNMFSLLMTKEVGDAQYAMSHQMKFGLSLYNNQKCSDEKGFTSDIIYYPYDKEKKIDRAYYEGFIIANDIKAKLGSYMVYNKKLNGFRAAEYDDFCIILDRKDHFEIFKRVLEASNIPVVIYADNTVSDSYPAMVILNILRLISYHFESSFTSDYYHALTSVLRSFICEKSDEEIFEIVSKRKLDNEVSKKARTLSYLIDTTDCASILNEALEMFDFYSKIKLVSNINDALHAAEFIANKLSELAKMGYHFTQIVEELGLLIKSADDAKYSMDVSTAHGVKMMNIHKSKGLEYPICYFADFNHAYNKSSIKASTGFDLKYGIYTQINDGGIDDTMIKTLYNDAWTKETVSERLRLFYVALTRAREKMIFIRDETNYKDAMDTDMQSSFGQYFDYIEDKAPNIFKNKIHLKEAYFDKLDVKAIEGHFYSLGLKENLQMKYEVLNLDIKKIKNDHISKRMNKISNKQLDQMLDKGINLHYILEMLNFKHPFDSLEEMNLDQNTKKVIENVLKMDLMKNISQAKTLHEYEFSSIIDNKAYHGIIDLLVIYDDHIDSIDYKLKNFDDEAYDRQLKLYKDYINSKANKPVKCHLLSIIDAKSREVEV